MRALSIGEVLALNQKQRTKYFEQYSRFFEDAPAHSRYAIRVGSTTLLSSDTYDLRMKFDSFLDRENI